MIPSLGIIAKIKLELSGAPSYTSGAQIWKGAHASLNKSVDRINNTPTNRSSLAIIWLTLNNKRVEISFKLNVPSTEKINTVPSKKQPDIKDPAIKYFSPASDEKEDFRL